MGNKVRFERLFEPGRIREMNIRNRIVMPAMASFTDSDDGFVTDVTKDYYEARAKGGVGLIIAGSCCVDWPVGISGRPRLTIHDDKFIPGLTEVTQIIHRHGAKAGLQLQHAGPAAHESITGMQPVAASAVDRTTAPEAPVYDLPRELSVSEIQDVIARFAKAAERAQKAGFDGVELHGAHRYLINSFLSPYYNRRQDKYGGDLRNRARFLLEIMSAVREAVGRNYPVWCRLNGEERDVEGGITIKMVKELAQMLQEAGIDAIHVSVWPNRDTGYPPGFAVDLAAEVKKVVSIPVIAVGRIDARVGERLLRQKKADFIAMGRTLLVDPEFPNKAASGRLDDVMPCLYCNTCLRRDSSKTIGILTCALNPYLAKEREYEIHPAEKTKKVVVVGGGPGGMEAARVAALRGHQVVLYEKEQRLGGQLTLASILREEDERLIKYLATQIKKLGVKVELGKEFDASLIADIKPDAIVLATGATSSLPEIPGIDRDNILSASDIQEMMHGYLQKAEARRKVSLQRRLWYLGIIIMRIFGPSTMKWLLRFWAPFGKRVIVVGIGLAGVEIADFLVERGKRVTIVDKREELPINEPPMPALRLYLENRLTERGASILTGVRYYEAITDKGLTIINKQGVRQTIEGDTIVFAADYKPNTELSQVLAGMPYEVHQVGDCVEPCGVGEAIRDGSRIGRAI